MNWYRRACRVCGGDLHDDAEQPNWVMCVLCARSFRLQAGDGSVALQGLGTPRILAQSGARARIQPLGSLFASRTKAS